LPYEDRVYPIAVPEDVLDLMHMAARQGRAMIPVINRNSALLLDIDGTLLDIAASPGQVVVPPALIQALTQLAADLSGAFAFVSGRSLENIDHLFAPFRPAAIGAHGGEIRGVSGQVARTQPMPEAVRALFVRLARDNPDLLLEDKGVGLALHYRGTPGALPMLETAMAQNAALLADTGVQLLYGKAVLDARPFGVDKGSAVVRLSRQVPFAGRRILYGGDDTTDLDVFRILPALEGHGFSVGQSFPGAEHVFRDPEAVRRWLIELAGMGVGA
jgi:trehalose 6-phosphate phosphatase